MITTCKMLKENVSKFKGKISDKCQEEENDNLKNWKILAEEKQEFYCKSLGSRTWEKYCSNEIEFLKLKIGFAIFGPSVELVDEIGNDEPEISFEDPVQLKTIDQITQKICEVSEKENIYASFIFIIAYLDEEYAEFPLVRVYNNETNSIYFVDMLGRVYKDWADFLNNNELPNCAYCYPKNGFYSYGEIEKVDIEYGFSPESSKMRKFLKKIDTVNLMAGLGSAAVGVAALAVPLSSPIVLGSAVAGLTSGVWSTLRTTRTLLDRKKHSQTLSLADQSARACWLSLTAGIIGGASAGALQYTEFFARSGHALSRLPCIAVNSLEIGSIGVEGLSIINHMFTIIHKKEFSGTDCAHLILSILFFFHASLTFKTAKDIILDIKNSILNNVEKEMSGEQKNSFLTSLVNETIKNDVKNHAEIIKSLKTIQNKGAFYKEVVGITNEANFKLTINGDDFIHINNKIQFYSENSNQ